MEETSPELDSSAPRAREHDYLSYESPLPPGLVPPPSPAARGEKIWASPSLAPSTGPKASKLPLNPGLLWKTQVLQDLA